LEFRKSPESLAVLVVGSDTLIEALPARPIQLAHACGALGFDLVVPLSWGDELVAESALRALAGRHPSPAVMCACPLVRERLVQVGADLASSLISLTPPPVAVARHLRTIVGNQMGSLSFVGKCPGASETHFDVIYRPQDFLAEILDRGIRLDLLPETFEDRFPADRRRHVSLPGGCPAPEALWQRCNEMTLLELEGSDIAIDLAQHLMSPHPVLLDIAPALGCHCSGVTDSSRGASARVAVMSLEPPRSRTPTVTEAFIPDLTEAVVGPTAGSTTGIPRRPPMAVTPPGVIRSRR
jgi:hypothetical protein